MAVGGWILLVKMDGDGAEILLCQGDRDVRLEPANRIEKVHTSIGGRRVSWSFVHRQRGPDTVQRRRHGETETRRHDANDAEQFSAEMNVPPNDGRVSGKFRYP